MSTRLKNTASSCVTATLLLVAYSFVRSAPETFDQSLASVHAANATGRTPIAAFVALQNAEPSIVRQALKTIRKNWSNGDAVMLLEASRFSRNQATRRSIKETLSEMTGQSFVDSDDWYHWIWKQTNAPHPQYATFKQTLYSRIDGRFAEYFAPGFDSNIRLDEIRWGGVRRDYGEGVAYQDYFATDELMFTVPKIDTRLKNKQQVFTVRLDDAKPVAISTSFLESNRVHHEQMGDQNVVVLRDEGGANRAYATEKQTFKRWIDPSTVIDDSGDQWQVSETGLQNKKTSQRLKRLPAHRAFWFGWHSAFPNTRLVH